MSNKHFASKKGEDIVTASGRTLLGADDKAGVAIVMTFADELLRRPDLQHGAIRVCLNPDEEVGHGVDGLELEEFGADVAYTLDGEDLGEVSWETFSADGAVVTIEGVSTHPGEGKKHNGQRADAGGETALVSADQRDQPRDDGEATRIHPPLRTQRNDCAGRDTLHPYLLNNLGVTTQPPCPAIEIAATTTKPAYAG